jgi:hypothetical protein
VLTAYCKKDLENNQLLATISKVDRMVVKASPSDIMQSGPSVLALKIQVLQVTNGFTQQNIKSETMLTEFASSSFVDLVKELRNCHDEHHRVNFSFSIDDRGKQSTSKIHHTEVTKAQGKERLQSPELIKSKPPLVTSPPTKSTSPTLRKQTGPQDSRSAMHNGHANGRI